MRYTDTPLDGVVLIDLEQRGDERGWFSRVFCSDEFPAHGLMPAIAQVNNSFTADRYTLRGMHYQLPPSAEAKVVRCVRGALFDVALDLRPDSPTYLQWFGHELTAENRTSMYIPEGCAHGLMTLEPDTEAIYLMSAAYDVASERGVRWDDPRFGIEWPAVPSVVSAKDHGHSDYRPEEHYGAAGR